MHGQYTQSLISFSALIVSSNWISAGHLDQVSMAKLNSCRSDIWIDMQLNRLSCINGTLSIYPRSLYHLSSYKSGLCSQYRRMKLRVQWSSFRLTRNQPRTWTWCLDSRGEHWFSVTQSSESAGWATVSMKRCRRGEIRREKKNPHGLFVWFFAETSCNYEWECFKWVHFYFYFCKAGLWGHSVECNSGTWKLLHLKAKLSPGWISSRCRMVK